MSLKVGYAQAPITPSLTKPVYLAGFGRNRRAQSIHDDLFVRALALSDGPTTVVALALDLIGLAREQCLKIEAQVNETIPDAALIIACTHTHHGPDTLGLWGPDEATSGVDPQYLSALQKKAASTALAALDRLQPALVKSAAVLVPGLAKNARDAGILDEELTCLQFSRAGSGEVQATWLIYPCHPEVLWDENPHITSDYLQSMRARLESRTGAPCLAMVGALGGMMTPDVSEHSFSEAVSMGETLAEAGLAALANSQAQVSRLDFARHEFTMPLQNPLFIMAAQAGLLTTTFNQDGTIRTEASLLKIGDSWLFGVPGELFPKLGLAYRQLMKEAGAAHAAVIGLANDELGYILPAEDFIVPQDYLEPGDSYEESMSVGPDAGPQLTQTLKQHLLRVESESPDR